MGADPKVGEGRIVASRLRFTLQDDVRYER